MLLKLLSAHTTPGWLNTPPTPAPHSHPIYLYVYVDIKGGHPQFKSAPPQLRNIADNQIYCGIAD
jgi:hypothetical protein